MPLVGVIRFERTTSPSRTVRATKLRHTPTLSLLYSLIEAMKSPCYDKKMKSIEQLIANRPDNDQISEAELKVILRELTAVLGRRVAGEVVELGCYNGGTSVLLGQLLHPTNKQLYLYDSFSGLPEKSVVDASPAGLQFKTGELLASRSLVEKRFKQAGLRRPRIKKAWFSELTPSDLPEEICFAFLDGDYYESIHDSLKLVWPKLAEGAVVVVDDYTNEALPGAARAVDEWLSTHNSELRVEQSLAIIRPKA